jgi:hypothetical protein
VTVPTLAPALAVTPFAHQPWCVEHWFEDDVCWAPDLDFQIHPTPDDSRGRITVMMTHNPQPNPRRANRSRSLTLFLDRFPDGEDGLDMDPEEAEVAGHALLAMAALAKGLNGDYEQHRATAARIASALLARRSGGAR